MLWLKILRQVDSNNYFCADDVSAGPMTTAAPSSSSGPPAGAQLPYPTLYGQQPDPGRPGNVIHALLVNIARMLGSVAAGYDIGLSNKMPYHPKMDPLEPESEEPLVWYNNDQSGGARGPGAGLYPHNTYHGHTPHHRTPLQSLRFTDSPVITTGDSDIVQPPPPVATGPGLDRPLFVPAPDYNDSGHAPAYTMARTARYYHDQLECEREYYQDHRHQYKDSPRRQGSVTDTTSLAFSNPNYESQQPHSRGQVSRVTFGHRRTPSGSSQTYQYDHDRSGPSSSEYQSERPPPLVPRRLSRQGSYSSEVERPQTLELTPRTPLRSSLKKYNYPGGGSSQGSSSGLGRSSGGSGWTPHSGWGSGGGTPTGDTNSSSDEVNIFHPPSKSDSGFVSSNRITSAVTKFSPRGGEKYTDWSPTGEIGGSNREIVTRDFHPSDLRRSQRQGSYSADSPSRRTHHPYADFITDNDLKKGYDNY